MSKPNVFALYILVLVGLFEFCRDSNRLDKPNKIQIMKEIVKLPYTAYREVRFQLARYY